MAMNITMMNPNKRIAFSFKIELFFSSWVVERVTIIGVLLEILTGVYPPFVICQVPFPSVIAVAV